MTQASNNRLSALSGFPVKDRADAMTGLATGNRPGKPAAREQVILTPQCIVDVCNKMWGQIALDPCWAPGAITDPLHRFEYPHQDGLKDPWIRFSFINPPYKDLKAWLAYGRTQPDEQIWLVPVRTHRKWWRAWRDELDAYVELDGLKFLGYNQVFPAPLLLGYTGETPRHFIKVSSHLGSAYSWRG